MNRHESWFWTNPVRNTTITDVKKIPGVHCFRFLMQHTTRFGIEIFVPDTIQLKRKPKGQYKLFLALNTFEQHIQHLVLVNDKVNVLFTEDFDRSESLIVFADWSKKFPSKRFNQKTGLRKPFKHAQDITGGTHRKTLKPFAS